jgi:hypothetical protein
VSLAADNKLRGAAVFLRPRPCGVPPPIPYRPAPVQSWSSALGDHKDGIMPLCCCKITKEAKRTAVAPRRETSLLKTYRDHQ